MYKILFYLLLAKVSNGLHYKSYSFLHPDTGLNVLQLIQKYGYPVESHENIVTEDGYLLTLQRIPHGKQNANVLDRPPVLLMHGMSPSTADWVNNGPERGLGFLLADLGYDVWMGNARGTTWSRKHVTLDPDRDKKLFWDFSWHEIGFYDLPASIDYILKQTQQDRIFYIGHSQGTTTFFVMASLRPEYNKKIRLMVAFSPAVSISNVSPLVAIADANFGTIKHFLENLDIYEFPRTELVAALTRTLCNDQSGFQSKCALIIFLLTGPNPAQLDNSLIPVIGTNAPAGLSRKQLYHYLQIKRSDKFAQYDYGPDENMKRYNNAFPPLYNLSKITTPVALYYGSNDWLIDKAAVEKLAKELPNAVELHLIEDRFWNHIDFLWARDVVPLLYNKVFDIFGRY